jgi:photosystem II stability/assembly factor-like uncharacterized protein
MMPRPLPPAGGPVLALCALALVLGTGGAHAQDAAKVAAVAPATIVPQESGVAVQLRGISAVSADVAWASGREGTVLRTVDGGAHWQAMHVPGAGKLDFRDVEGFDADTAVVLSIGPGADSRVYRTTDGGAHWQLALQNTDDRAFFDCMAFDGQRGWMLGDPVDGAFQVYATADGGRSWAMQPAAAMPPAMKDEAAFAASGTCMAITPWGRRMVVGGGGAARAYVDDADASHWTANATPLPARVPAAGIFSATPAGGDMLLVGGDFEHAGQGSAALAQLLPGGALRVSPLPDPRSYRSGAACAGDAHPRCVAVGPGGADLLVDGRWQPLSDTGYDAIDFFDGGSAAGGSGGWASGDKGRIARVTLAPAP